MGRALFVCFVIFALRLGQVIAGPADLPLEDFVITDGLVYAPTETNGVLYFSGSFTLVARRTGSGVPVSATTGPEARYPMVNGTVSEASRTDAAGGLSAATSRG